MDLSERSAATLGAATRRHPWEIERFRAYRRILADHGALDSRRVLDVGAGDGWFSESLLESLADDAEVYCWDTNYASVDLAVTDPRVTRSVEPPSGTFDLALVLDVLEHVGDPSRLIDESLRPVLPPGTPVLVAVPAHQWLFSRHDVALGHHRRYRRSELRDQVTPWLELVEEGPLFVSLIPPRAAAVCLERLRGAATDADVGVGSWNGGPLLTRSIRSVLAADARLTRRGPARRLPGLSTWLFGRVAGAST